MTIQKRQSIIIIAIIAATISIIVAAYDGEVNVDQTNNESIDNPNITTLQGEIRVGVILPLTGDLSTHGNENLAGIRLGVEDFNQSLKENGDDWYIKLVIEDSATNPVVALEKLQSINAKNIDIVMGVETSSNIRNMKGYADSNDMLLVSCCSSAPSLAVPNDSVYRLVPDDSNQGAAISALLNESGIKMMIPLYRGDTWGDGLKDATVNSFTSSGGISHEGIRYNPETAEFSASTSLLAQQVRDAIEIHGKDNVAIVILSFSEALQIMQSSAAHDVLDDVRWFGPGALTKEHKLVNDPIGLEFTTAVDFTTVQFAASQGPAYQRVQDTLIERLGVVPNSFVHASYDVAFTVGLAILDTQSSDATDVKKVYSEIVDKYNGATGDIKLNAAGDLASADYEVWGVRDAHWISLGKYEAASDKITIFSDSINDESQKNIDYSEKESITKTEVSKLIKNYEKYGKTYFDVINAMKTATTPDSTEYYPFAVENESFIILAHGADITRVGKVAVAMFSADKPITQIQSELEENGFTWITYKWENPTNGLVEGKTSYLVLQEDGVILGSGYYLD